MRPKISVVGGAGLVEKLAERNYAQVVSADDADDVSGSDVVVLADPGEELFADIRDRAPNAVVIAVGRSPAAVCEATLFPRARIIGVADEAAATEVVDAIVLDRDQTVTVVVRLEGERGVESDFAEAPVKIGAGGIKAIFEEG